VIYRAPDGASTNAWRDSFVASSRERFRVPASDRGTIGGCPRYGVIAAGARLLGGSASRRSPAPYGATDGMVIGS
jgi:hypothetical protein